MKVDLYLKRMDSMMVTFNIKKMSRLELLYTCVSNLAKELQNTYSDSQFLKDALERMEK